MNFGCAIRDPRWSWTSRPSKAAEALPVAETFRVQAGASALLKPEATRVRFGVKSAVTLRSLNPQTS